MKKTELFREIGYIDGSMIEEAATANRKFTARRTLIKWGSIAACMALMWGVGSSLLYNAPPQVPQITQQAPAAQSPSGVRKLLNYNGYRYAFVNNGAEFNLSQLNLSDTLGTLEYDITKGINGSENPYAELDYSSTFAVGGTLYKLPTYDPGFRIAVHHDGKYYIAEMVGKIDNTALTASEYFKVSGLREKVTQVHIQDHFGRKTLYSSSDIKAARKMIGGLYEAVPASLSSEAYEALARAQTEGKSYQLAFQLADSTSVTMYIIPEMKVISIGDSYYTVPEVFMTDFGDIFAALPQESNPVVY